MSIHPPALADHFARLRATAQAQDAHAWSLHAVIAAILARIFSRLEQLLLLWQSGALPLPPPARPTHRQPAAHTSPPVILSKAKDPRFRPHAPGFWSVPHSAELRPGIRARRSTAAIARAAPRMPAPRLTAIPASYHVLRARAPPSISGPIRREPRFARMNSYA